ncbi:MAG TPA: hypothetical protein VF779_02570 [Pyrinomonadaceae bacterium]
MLPLSLEMQPLCLKRQLRRAAMLPLSLAQSPLCIARRRRSLALSHHHSAKQHSRHEMLQRGF